MPHIDFFRKRTERERAQVLARLAASETASMISSAVDQSSVQDRAKAIQRLAKLSGFTDQQTLGELLDITLQWLRECPLNINFNSKDFFSAPVSGGKYMTKFEEMRQAGGPVPANPKGSTRDVAEQKMFGYERKGPAAPDPTDKGLTEAGNRIQAFGDMNSPDFQGAIRPKYCTLNVWKALDGSGAQWGRSFFVLKDYLKTTSSFVHTDSFDFTSSSTMWDPLSQRPIAADTANVSGTVSTYTNMSRLVIYASDNLLESIVDCAVGATLPDQPYAALKARYQLGPTLYVEAHVHGEIHFGRDIAELKVSTDEVGSARDPAAIKANLASFSGRYGIPLSYY